MWHYETNSHFSLEALQLFGFERLEAAIIQRARGTASDIKQAILTGTGPRQQGISGVISQASS